MVRGNARAMVILILAGLLCAAPSPGLCGELGQEKFKPGDAAPDFTLMSLANENITLSGFMGKKVVVLNFWGLRCSACIEEMPYLDAIHNRYRDKGLVVLGVDTDGVGIEDVVATLKEIRVAVGYPLLVDPEFAVTDAYTNFLVPLTIVIDKTGKIRYIHTGFEKGDEKKLESAVKKALGS